MICRIFRSCLKLVEIYGVLCGTEKYNCYFTYQKRKNSVFIKDFNI